MDVMSTEMSSSFCTGIPHEHRNEFQLLRWNSPKLTVSVSKSAMSGGKSTLTL